MSDVESSSTMLLTVLLVLLQTTNPPSSTIYEVSVEEDGTGIWFVEHRYVLKTGEDLEAFKAAAASIAREAETEYRVRVEGLVAEASSILGRGMKLSDFKVTTDVRQTLTGIVGIVAISFKWHGFAVRKDETLTVGDVFVGGLSLMDGESLTVKTPDRYVIETVSPKPDEVQAILVRWYGKKSFSDGEPRLVLSSARRLTSSNTWSLDWLSGHMLTLLPAAAAVLIVLFIVIRRGKHPVENTDIQMVLDVVRKHGGAVPQSVIVEETGMSKAKVSMILKMLEEDGRLLRVKRGRQKLVRIKT